MKNKFLLILLILNNFCFNYVKPETNQLPKVLTFTGLCFFAVSCCKMAYSANENAKAKGRLEASRKVFFDTMNTSGWSSNMPNAHNKADECLNAMKDRCVTMEAFNRSIYYLLCSGFLMTLGIYLK